MIKVLVVDDSPLMADILCEVINSDPELTVAGVARNGAEAVDLASRLKPDIISMDINMPVMNGLEATKQIMAYTPTPILIVSSAIKSDFDKVFKAISFGALDAVGKDPLEDHCGEKNKETIYNIIAKLKFLSKVKVIHHPLAKLERPKIPMSGARPENYHLARIVGIAASTGGPKCLQEILKRFPANFPCGIVIVQHISSGFTEGLVEWLSGETHIQVKIPKNGEIIKPSTAYIAPFGSQMTVTNDGAVVLSDDPPHGGFKPSGDILLESVAKVYESGAIGVILTGMGADGAAGIKAIKDAGGKTIAESETTAVVFGMPKAAIEMGAVDKILPVEKIAEEIITEL